MFIPLKDKEFPIPKARYQMKRFFSILSVLVLVVSFSVAAGAADGLKLYARCAGCHGADGSKQAMGVSAALKGQSAADLEKKLQGYADGTYGGAKKMIMVGAAKKLSAEEIKTLAEFIAGF